MSTTEMTLDEIRQRGHAALLKELGPIGYVRFLQQYNAGKGDFTVERREWVDSMSVADIRAALDGRKSKTP